MFKTLLLLTATAFFLYSCGKDNPVSNPTDTTLRISAITPNPARTGQIITIEGKNFSSKKGSNKVVFPGNQTIYPDSGASARLVMRVPQGATSGMLRVYVGETYASAQFTLETKGPAFSIESFSPKADEAGKPVKIVMKDFQAAAQSVVVLFGGVKAAQTSLEGNIISAVIPVNAKTGPITVMTDAGLTLSSEDFTVIAAPVITRFNPQNGPVGTDVVIYGQNFPINDPGLAVLLDGDTATITSRTSSQITIEIPPGKAVKRKIQIRTAAGIFESESEFELTSRIKFSEIKVVINRIQAKFRQIDTLYRYRSDGTKIKLEVRDTSYTEELEMQLQIINGKDRSNGNTARFESVYKQTAGIFHIDSGAAAFIVSPLLSSMSDISLFRSKVEAAGTSEFAERQNLVFQEIGIPLLPAGSIIYDDVYGQNAVSREFKLSKVEFWQYRRDIAPGYDSGGDYSERTSSSKQLVSFSVNDRTFISYLYLQ